GAGPQGLPTLQIGERMVETTPGLTGLLDRLVAKEVVDRRRCEVDRRRVYCTLTAEGLQVLGRLDEPVEAWEHSVVKGLSEDDVRDLIEKLNEIRSALEPAK
ncbi:MAG: winged helix-turn-helix transcriptional regulator, partial [Acidobacteria bacterium]|nr:winged helix-turn-helix transcriptional regulator [Acidobacteriota bacterium]